MKRSNYYWLLSLLLLGGMTSCKDKDDDEPLNPDFPTESRGVYILNQGNMYNNIAGGMYAIDYAQGTVTKNAFQKANGRSLGDTPQCGICYGSKVYIGVYNSNTIEIADRNSLKSVKQISLASSDKGEQPRSMAAHGGKIYISMYDGYVARLDTATLTIDAAVKVGPNPEKICIYNNRLYVPNSDGMSGRQDADGNYIYGETASVIDLDSFTVVETLKTPMNPTQFSANENGLFLLANGNYSTIGSAAYRFDGKEFVKIADATIMEPGRRVIYMVNAPFYGDTPLSFFIYDPASGKTNDWKPMNVEYPSNISVDRLNDRLFIASYVMNGQWPSYDAPGYVVEYSINAEGTKCENSGKYNIGSGPTYFFYNNQ